MIKEVTMYQVVCDEPGCELTAQDGGEFAAWSEAWVALDEARDADWYVRPDLHLCPEHGYMTACMGGDYDCPRRDVTEADDGWVYCPEHIAEGMDS